ncbi:MAG: VIT1/CCC1 transporter family protein, partial [Deltaproteobacteria bacterium]|nr:VIT1/CCC1 transporter family protein [Deltaproteobacteria bacterium]
VETRHYRFWEDFFQIKIERLNLGRRLKLGLIALVSRLFGEKSMYLILEAIEIYGIRKYLAIWKIYQDTPLAGAVKKVLEDEFGHEDTIVSGTSERKINPEKIRNIFLGFNDGLVELLGAVSGFFAAFQNVSYVLIAGFTTAAAGAISMAIGAYLATGSEKEIEQTEREKDEFLSGRKSGMNTGESPFRSATVVGISYLVGCSVPILPVFFGSKSVLISWTAGGAMLILVSLVLAFISGMNMKKRVATNLILITTAVAVSYAIGSLVNRLFGISSY